MKRDSNLIKKIVLTLTGIFLCIILICDYSDRIYAQEYQGYSNSIINANLRNTNSTSNYDEKNYDVVYSDTVMIKEKRTSIKIFLNPEMSTDGIIKIDNQEIPLNPELAKTVGYAHGKAKAYDFTGDGNEEIALVISGGASGAFQAIQVFGNTDEKWNEINIPSDIYRNIPDFMKKQQKKLDIKMDDSLIYYRTISFKKEKILISYQILSNSDMNVIGEIRKELFYSSDKKEFVLGDTLVLPGTNKNCMITTSARKNAIIIQWNLGVRKSSVKGAQIKVATKKNMKDAKIYKFGKEKAQKMSYEFTIQSGKIAKNKNYYFKVRLKVGKKWTKWSDVKKSKINKK